MLIFKINLNFVERQNPLIKTYKQRNERILYLKIKSTIYIKVSRDIIISKSIKIL